MFTAQNRTSQLQPYEDGFFPVSSIFGGVTQFNDFGDDVKKFNAVFSNPALLKVFCLQCDLFSLGKIKILSASGVELPNDPALKLLLKPNPLQSDTQFLWDLMFNYMIGNVYCLVDSDIPSEDNKLYFLEIHKMEWPLDFDKKKDKLVFSKASEKSLLDTPITYRYADGTSTTFPLRKIICLTDLSNGQGNFFKGQSRIPALYKILSNADCSLDSTNINIRYSGKFLVAGTQSPSDVTKLPMGKDEKDDIETKVNGRKQVHAIKSMIDIKRFVENMGQLKLDEAYRTAYFLIGSMYNIPRDVLEAYLQGSTFDNQEKSTAKHVSYTLQPKADDFFGALADRFKYTDKRITVSWDHLPFMQVFEKERAQTQNTQIQTLTAMLKLGIDIKEANDFLHTNFKTGKYEQPKPAASTGAAA